MFYHDHAAGITRLNVYAGMAAPYILVDQVEDDMIHGTNVSGAFTTPKQVLPNLGGVILMEFPWSSRTGLLSTMLPHHQAPDLQEFLHH